jgi:hypothetical protein
MISVLFIKHKIVQTDSFTFLQNLKCDYHHVLFSNRHVALQERIC